MTKNTSRRRRTTRGLRKAVIRRTCRALAILCIGCPVANSEALFDGKASTEDTIAELSRKHFGNYESNSVSESTVTKYKDGILMGNQPPESVQHLVVYSPLEIQLCFKNETVVFEGLMDIDSCKEAGGTYAEVQWYAWDPKCEFYDKDSVCTVRYAGDTEPDIRNCYVVLDIINAASGFENYLDSICEGLRKEEPPKRKRRKATAMNKAKRGPGRDLQTMGGIGQFCHADLFTVEDQVCSTDWVTTFHAPMPMYFLGVIFRSNMEIPISHHPNDQFRIHLHGVYDHRGMPGESRPYLRYTNTPYGGTMPASNRRCRRHAEKVTAYKESGQAESWMTGVYSGGPNRRANIGRGNWTGEMLIAASQVGTAGQGASGCVIHDGDQPSTKKVTCFSYPGRNSVSPPGCTGWDRCWDFPSRMNSQDGTLTDSTRRLSALKPDAQVTDGTCSDIWPGD